MSTKEELLNKKLIKNEEIHNLTEKVSLLTYIKKSLFILTLGIWYVAISVNGNLSNAIIGKSLDSWKTIIIELAIIMVFYVIMMFTLTANIMRIKNKINQLRHSNNKSH